MYQPATMTAAPAPITARMDALSHGPTIAHAIRPATTTHATMTGACAAAAALAAVISIALQDAAGLT